MKIGEVIAGAVIAAAITAAFVAMSGGSYQGVVNETYRGVSCQYVPAVGAAGTYTGTTMNSAGISLTGTLTATDVSLANTQNDLHRQIDAAILAGTIAGAVTGA
jgi:hypothetical protein